MSYPVIRRLPLLPVRQQAPSALCDLIAQVPRASGVVALMDQGLRNRLGAGIADTGDIYHAESAQSAQRLLRERPVGAVLIAADTGEEELEHLSRLLLKSGASAVAVMDKTHIPTARQLLKLGASGVRDLIDLSTADGWNCLRNIMIEGTDGLPTQILSVLHPLLDEASECTRSFFTQLVHRAPHTTTVRELAHALKVHPSSFMSRFYRARLPSPKSYLAAMRLIYVRAHLDTPGTPVSHVAYRLEYSSPQSLGRHVRRILGMTPSELREKYSFALVVTHYVSAMILPFRNTWKTFCPLGGPSG